MPSDCLPGTRAEDWKDVEIFEMHENESSIQGQSLNQESAKFYRMRLICKHLNQLFCLLEEECSPASCSEMKAGEWLYLCAAHHEPKQCSAIDYISHTLEGAQALLGSEVFYSQTHSPETTGKLIQNVARRLYRIFAHTWYHHKEIFVNFEAETGLYQQFMKLTTKDYEMITPKMITIPS